jgi:U3 small nucleolar RNA-associated protein 25
MQASAVFVCEYSRESEISRGRAWFYQGRKNIMVYSGRAHFFRRFKIRGAKHLIFYSSPEYPHFYPELVNMLGEVIHDNISNGDLSEDMSCLTLFTPCDKMALDRIIGPKRTDHMLSSNKSTFLFF